MDQVIIRRMDNTPARVRDQHPAYTCAIHPMVTPQDASRCVVSVVTVPPGKMGVPYHYHLASEEVFYILKGEGLLRTPQGEQSVIEGDCLFFPTGDQGAHRLTNTSDTEPLVYLDYATRTAVEVVYYPDTDKLGVGGPGISKFYDAKKTMGYYDREPE